MIKFRKKVATIFDENRVIHDPTILEVSSEFYLNITIYLKFS
jgi:hypothetical protein